MNSQLNILFMALASRANNDDEAPVYCRLTFNKRQQRFMVGERLPLSMWDRDKQRAKGKAPKAAALNARIAQITQQIHQAEATLIKRGESFEVEDIVNLVLNRGRSECRTLMQAYKYRYQQMKKMKDKGYTASTLVKFSQLSNAVQAFIRRHHKTDDLPLSKLNNQFLHELETYLFAEKSMKLVSVNKVVQKLKSVVRMAVDFNWIADNPFPGHHFKHERIKVVFLTHEELQQLEGHTFTQERLRKVRDIFLFSVYTGLHYSDAMSLTEENVITGVDGAQWIRYTRAKTGKEIHIPLLNNAKQLIAHFREIGTQFPFLLPRFSNQKINSYLKEVADIAGLDTPLTHKIARKTFGSLLLYHNVPMKVVSELMGHSTVLVTERHYAQVELKKLGLAMAEVGEMLSPRREE
ncbi:site-specific integrase [Chitinophaga sp. GCM10012297]|uniref:Site-specific integrase n=1 Tax=Chitinophaga chungangae TaxID=2821488 RepID=A0ABS3YE96_9BACT|nr:site-specific integrase [Chitinophaga chungangae]MBO9153002.1 site-specific integrase [Chitinophaga chungangae]